nr:MAG TPA: hypothetical protein [Caudoviricetes sp.]
MPSRCQARYLDRWRTPQQSSARRRPRQRVLASSFLL